MHPSKIELRLFVEGQLDDSGKKSEISTHLKKCEFCKEFCDNYVLYIKSLVEAGQVNIPEKFKSLADRLYKESFGSRIIYMTSFKKTPTTFRLAADGTKRNNTGVENLSTFYSENPELVLRIMRDKNKGYDYIQLIGENQEITSNVLVQIPELKKEFLTDAGGRAKIEESLLMELSHLKWQIKLPDAVFSLEPLVYDPESVQYKKEVMLETEKADKIKICFEGKTEGKQISIRVLQLEGKQDFGPIKILLSQKNRQQIKETAADKDLYFEIIDPDAEINIRLFA